MLLFLNRPNFYWISFYICVLLAWMFLALMSQESVELKSLEKIYGSDFWKQLCKDNPSLDHWLSILLMWVVMSFAMMAPTIIPALKTYDDLIYSGAGNSMGFFHLLTGFSIIWICYSILITSVQIIVSELGWLTTNGTINSQFFVGLLLALSGFYQFSAFKNACLSKCRAPLAFFLQYWSDGKLGAFKMGLRLGVICLGCCWMLMALTFISGIMSLAFMGLCTMIMILEKLPQIGEYVTKPMGFCFLGGAILIWLKIVNFG